MTRTKFFNMALTRGALILIMLIGSSAVHAMPVQWTLNAWTLSNSATVSGSFVYDADLGAFSNVVISSTFGPTSYTFDGVNADANTLEFEITLGARSEDGPATKKLEMNYYRLNIRR